MPSKEGIRLAEDAEWDLLIEKLVQDVSIARQKDHYGMLPLHWACTENDVPTAVLKDLVAAYPEGALTKNNAQLLPLHIAIRAKCPPSSIKFLCQAHPSGITNTFKNGQTPLELAYEVGLCEESIQVLEEAKKEFMDLAKDHSMDDVKKDIERQSEVINRMSSKRDSRKSETSVSSFPRASEGDVCGVCGQKLKLSSKRYNCHSCKMLICEQDVAGKIILPNGSIEKEMCRICFKLNNQQKEEKSDLRHSSVSPMLGSISTTETETVNNVALPQKPSDESNAETNSTPDSKHENNHGKSNEMASLLQRIQHLETSNHKLSKIVEEQEEVHLKAMLLLTQTMTRVAELEVKLNRIKMNDHSDIQVLTEEQAHELVLEVGSPVSFPVFDEDFELPLSP